MTGSIGRSLDMFRCSWGVLAEDKRLVVFPFVSALAGLVVVAFFALPVLTLFVHSTTTVDIYGMEHSGMSIDPLGWVLMAVGYVVTMYVGTFMNAALSVAANERLTGTGPGTVSSGLHGAAAKAGPIFAWVLVAATVGYLLRLLEERMGLIGRIVIGIVGIAWSLLTFLMVPVLVFEENTTGMSIRRSAELFKRTWGENVIGNVGFGLIAFGVALVVMALGLVGILSGSLAIMAVMLAVSIVFVVVAAQVMSAMSGIFRVALYRYAVDGRAPQAYAGFDFDHAFRPKRMSGIFGGGSASRRTVWRSTPPDTADHDPWKPWVPPAEEPGHGLYGIDIPGIDGPPAPPGPPSPWEPHPPAPPPGSSGF